MSLSCSRRNRSTHAMERMGPPVLDSAKDCSTEAQDSGTAARSWGSSSNLWRAAKAGLWKNTHCYPTMSKRAKQIAAPIVAD